MPSEQNRVAETTTEFASLRPSRVVTERDVEVYQNAYRAENAPISTTPLGEFASEEDIEAFELERQIAQAEDDGMVLDAPEPLLDDEF